MNYPHSSFISSFRVSLLKEDFISLVKPKAVFKFHERKQRLTPTDMFFVCISKIFSLQGKLT